MEEVIVNLVVKMLDDMIPEFGDMIENFKRLLDIAYRAGYEEGYQAGMEKGYSDAQQEATIESK